MAFTFPQQKKGDRQLIVLELLVATNTFWLNNSSVFYIILLHFNMFFTLPHALIVAWIAFSYVIYPIDIS